MKKICIVTGTRAEYGLLYNIIKKIMLDEEMELKLVVTGAHLSPEFGLSYKQIEDDGFVIDKKIEIILSSDSTVAINKAIGLAQISFGEYFDYEKPDMVVVLGDRYEVFAVATAAAISKIPIAHIHGGETTEGATDEFLRHSITKMSYLHFTSTNEYRNRVIQLGESPERIFNVGSLGVENIKTIKLLEINELQKSIRLEINTPFVLVTFHPVTLEDKSSSEQFNELLSAIDDFRDMKVIFTKANADADGRIINQMIDEYVSRNIERADAYTSLGQVRYLSAMKHCSLVLGNSSSGIIEAPSFKVPTINIGDRQKGRVQAKYTLNCKPVKNEIVEAIKIANSAKFKSKIKNEINPYYQNNVSDSIVNIIKEYVFTKTINLKKEFYDIT